MTALSKSGGYHVFNLDQTVGGNEVKLAALSFPTVLDWGSVYHHGVLGVLSERSV